MHTLICGVRNDNVSRVLYEEHITHSGFNSHANNPAIVDVFG